MSFSVRAPLALLASLVTLCALGCPPPSAVEGEGDASEGEGDANEGEGDVAEGEGEGCVDDGDCDDGNACSSDRCVGGSCVFADVPDGVPCGVDGCAGTDACVGGACVADQVVVVDADLDGAFSDVCGGTDCDDTDGGIHPGAAEVCDDGRDNNCDGAVDDRDSDCGSSALCDVAGCWENPLPHGQALVALWPRGAGDLWFGSSLGVVSHNDGADGDGGFVNDRLTLNGFPTAVGALSGSPTGTMFAAAGAVFRYDDVSGLWLKSPGSDALGAALTRVVAFADDDVFALGSFGTEVFRGDGIAWSRESTGVDSNVHLTDLSGVANDDVWVAGVGFDAAAFGVVSHFDGTAWTPETLRVDASLQSGQGLTSIFAVASDDVWAVGELGVAWHNDGTGWSQIPTAASTRFTSIWGAASDDVWAAGNGALFHWNGRAWGLAFSPSSPFTGAFAVRGRAADDVWAVGGVGAVFHFDGVSWARRGDFVDDSFADVDANADGATAVAVGLSAAGTTVVQRAVDADGNVSWARDPRFPTTPRVAVAAVDVVATDDVWVAAGDVLHDDGTGWTSFSLPVPFALGATDVCAAADGRVYAAADDGVFAKDGAAFAEEFHVFDNESGAAVDRVFCAGADVWASGDAGVLHREGGVWHHFDVESLVISARRASPAPDDLWVVAPAPSSRDASTVSHFDGRDWERISMPGATADTHFLDVSAAAGQVWISGTAGYLARKDDTGITVVDADVVGDIEFVSALGADDVILVVSGASTEVFRLQGTQLTSLGVDDSIFTDNQEGRFVSPTFGVFIDTFDRIRFFEDGVFTDVNDAPRARRLLAFASDDIWTLNFDSNVFHYDGVTWTEIVLGDGFSDRTFDLLGTPDDLWIGTSNGVLYRGNDVDGFNVEARVARDAVQNFAGTGGDDLWVFGLDDNRDTFINRFDGAGFTPFITPRHLAQVQNVGGRTLAVGTDSGVWERTSAGWTQLAAPVDTFAATRSAFFFSATDALAASANGLTQHFDGTSWGSLGLRGESFSNAVGGEAGALFIVGNGGTIQRF